MDTELMKKLSALFEGDMILKYQLAAEDLDALVSVKSDEDLKHMFDEYDRHASEGSPRLRAFLFPSVPTVIETQQVASLDPHALEQRYIDAVNGIIRMNLSPSPSPRLPKGFGPYSPSRATFSISSACSSPKSQSPDSNPEYAALTQEAASVRSYHGNNPLHPMHKVHSSPVLYGLGNVPQASHGPAGYAPGHQQYGHYYGPNHHQHHHHSHSHQHQYSYHHPRPLQVEPYRGSGHDKLASATVVGRADIGKSPLNQGIGLHYPGGKSYRPASGGNNLGYLDDYGAYGYRRLDRADSLPHSPRATIWEGQCYNKGEQP